MKIADLFVDIGIKGDGPTTKALTGVKGTLGEISSVGFAAKAALLGVFYGLEQLMQASAGVGTGLMNFNSLTGLSAKELQQWQYAARQAGVEGEELTGSLKSVQNSMSNMLLGKGAPEGMAMVANKVGFDINKARDTFYVMQQLQKFAQQVPQDVGNTMLKSFGLSEGTISAMRRNAFNPQNFAKAPTYNEKEIGALNKVDVAWSNIGNKIKMAIGHFTAKEGLQIVQHIAAITDQVISLTQSIIKLGEALQVFKLFGLIAKGWDLLLNPKASNDNLAGIAKGFDSSKEGQTKAKDSPEGKFFNFLFGTDKTQGLAAFADKLDKLGGPAATPQDLIAPSTSNQINNSSSQSTNSTTINQNLNFQHDGRDHQKVGDTHKKAAANAYRQNPAQAGGF